MQKRWHKILFMTMVLLATPWCWCGAEGLPKPPKPAPQKNANAEPTHDSAAAPSAEEFGNSQDAEEDSPHPAPLDP